MDPVGPAGVTRPKHRRTVTGFGATELAQAEAQVPREVRQEWAKFSPQGFESASEFEVGHVYACDANGQALAVRHMETTLARSLFNIDDAGAYGGTALALRDRLVADWGRTQQRHTAADRKRIYYLSLEFLMGRALDNAMLNTGTKEAASTGMSRLGFHMEDIISQEHDSALGNGGLGRLAACFLDSMATMNMPAWGYGLRYRYGIFKQEIHDGFQVEVPDYWLDFNPWEFPRHDVTVDIQFYGKVRDYVDEEGRVRHCWQDGELVTAVAYDMPIPGYGTHTTNNLRLWSSKAAAGEFDFAKFNAGNYEMAVAEEQKAETISAVLYPNDNFDRGKELRLKQQYFWCSASLFDILRRYKATRHPWSEFPERVAIQLNDTHPTLATVELQRILVDIEGVEFEEAWDIVTRTFGYTNHTVMLEALEKWPVPLMEHLLPRHMRIIYDVNLTFLQRVARSHPGDDELLSRVSIIEESSPKMVRMANLAIVGSHRVNGVAALHSNLLKTTLFRDFVRIYGQDKFTNVTNGVTPRRWLHQANPRLSQLIADKLGGFEYLQKFNMIHNVEKWAADASFRASWRAIKQANKEHLAAYIRDTLNITVNTSALFDIQVKRIHEYKRQQLNIFGVIHRYLELKKMSPDQRARIVPRVTIIGGKAAPGYWMAKTIIHLVNEVGRVVNADAQVSDLLKVIFIPDYNVSKAEMLCPAADISEHISTAGTEGSGTSCMKFCINGSIIIGTLDGANVEIMQDVGKDNIYIFGKRSEEVEEIREEHAKGRPRIPHSLVQVFDAIRSGMFGDPNKFASLINSIEYGDRYLVSDDFDAYVATQSRIDADYKDQDSWVERCIKVVARMGFFSSDRCISDYAEEIWNVEPVSFE